MERPLTSKPLLAERWEEEPRPDPLFLLCSTPPPSPTTSASLPPPSLFCSSTFLFHLRLLTLPPKSPTSTTTTIVPYSLLTAIPPSSAADPAPHQSQQCLLSIKYLVRQGLCALAAWISSHPETIDDVCACVRAGVCALERFRRRDLDDKNLKCSFALFFLVCLFVF